ncbi:MAG: peptidoglycan binding domain-containing protein, partial [Chloroflexota bacterium]|nr:peptidoglycan binding domain-containing protein [Chloroflexota bacterium]
MSATAGFGGTTSVLGTTRRRRSVSSRALSRWLTGAFLVVAVVLGAGALGLGLYASAHAGRVYNGVEVAGVRVGGMAPAEARAALDERWARYAATPLTLAAGDQTFALTPAKAGARLDTEATLDAALAYGRGGSLWTRSREWTRALVRGATVAPRVVVDAAVAERELRAIAAEVVRTPTDAAIRMDAAGGPALVPDELGVAVDLGATQA